MVVSRMALPGTRSTATVTKIPRIGPQQTSRVDINMNESLHFQVYRYPAVVLKWVT